MNKYILSFLIISLLIPTTSATTFTRSLSKTHVLPGEIITVTIHVSLTQNESFYLIDEILPPNSTAFSPTHNGSLEHLGHVKWIELTNPKSTDLTYKLAAPRTPGTYYFTGEYGTDKTPSVQKIQGEYILTVSYPVWFFLFPVLLIILTLTLTFLLIKWRRK